MNAKTKSLLAKIPEAKTQKRGNKDVTVVDDLTPEVKAAIDSYVATGTAVKTMQDQMDRSKATITETADAIQQAYGADGKYQKSYRLVGTTHEITFTRNDTFQVPKTVSIKDVAAATSKAFAKENFEETVTLFVNPDIVADQGSLQELLAKLKEHDLLSYFGKEILVKAKPGLDSNQFNLEPEQAEALLFLGVKQVSGGLKA